MFGLTVSKCGMQERRSTIIDLELMDWYGVGVTQGVCRETSRNIMQLVLHVPDCSKGFLRKFIMSFYVHFVVDWI